MQIHFLIIYLHKIIQYVHPQINRKANKRVKCVIPSFICHWPTTIRKNDHVKAYVS